MCFLKWKSTFIQFRPRIYLKIPLIISLGQFRYWFGAKQKTIHYLSQWWLSTVMPYADGITRTQWVYGPRSLQMACHQDMTWEFKRLCTSFVMQVDSGDYFTNVSWALQHILLKFVYSINHTSYENFKICTCAQNSALGRHTYKVSA